MKLVKTPDHLKLEEQLTRCMVALKTIDIPLRVLAEIERLSPPLIMQMAHLCIMKEPPLPWQDALRWIKDHRDEIMAYAHGKVDVNGNKLG